MSVMFLFCMNICVCKCLLQNNIAGLPSSQATSGFPQYCVSTCVRFGCTRHASFALRVAKATRPLSVDKGKFCFLRKSPLATENLTAMTPWP